MPNSVGYPAKQDSYAGISNIAKLGLQYQLPFSRFTQSISPITISATAQTNGAVLLVISGGSDTYRYLVYVNSQPIGYYTASAGQITLSSLTPSVPQTIQVVATYATYVSNNLSSATRSPFSNTVSVTPLYQYAERDALKLIQAYDGGIGQYNQPPYDYIDVIRQPSLLYNTSFWESTNTYEDYDGPGSYAIPFSPPLKISIYTAKIKLKARLVNGSLDGTFFGAVDYVFQDADITVDNPFKALYGAEGHDIAYYYYQKITQLGLYQATMSANLAAGIAWRITKEYMFSKPYLATAIKNAIKNNFSLVMKSRDAMFQFRDIINFNYRLTNDFQDFIITYEGITWVNPKIVSTNGTPDEQPGPLPNSIYDLKTSKNRILKSGNSAAAILLSNPQDCAHYSFSTSSAPLSADDWFGSAPNS
jgi:hypothetical protein